MTGLLALLILIAVVAGGLVLGVSWIRTLADLLWMLALRRVLVGATTLGALLCAMGLIHVLAGFPIGSPTAFLIGLIVAPLVARPLADAIGWWWAGPGARVGIERRKNFIFAQRRQQQRDAYEAPPIDPGSD